MLWIPQTATLLPLFKTSHQEFWLRSSRNSKWSPPFFARILREFCEKNRYFWSKPIKQLDWRKKNETIVNMIAKVFNHQLFWKKIGKTSSLYLLSFKKFKEMAQKSMKALFGSHFEFWKLESWSICHSNILGQKLNGNVVELFKVRSNMLIFTVFELFWAKFQQN